MISIFFSMFMNIYEWVFEEVLTFLNFRSDTIMDIINSPIALYNTITPLAPKSFGAIDSILTIFIGLFFMWAFVSLSMKVLQVFLPNKIVG